MTEKVNCCGGGCNQHEEIQARIREMQYKKEQQAKFLQRFGRQLMQLAKDIHPKEQKTVLDCFTEDSNLNANKVITMLRNQNEAVIFTGLPYQVRYILNYLYVKGYLQFDEKTGTYRKTAT